MKAIKYLVLIFIIPVVMYAEGGSAYSRIGVGELQFFNSARRLALGELGTALFDQNNISLYNPAGWTKLTFTRFEVGLNYTGMFEQDQDSKAFYDKTEFAGSILGIPLQRDWGFTLVTGITPYSTVNYNIITPNILSQNDVYKGEGGLSRIYAGLSYELPLEISLGAALSYYTGTISYFTNMQNVTTDYALVNFKRSYRVLGIGGSFGVISGNLAKDFSINTFDDLRLGLTLDVYNSFDADTSLTVTTSSGGTQQLGTGISSLKIPYRLGLGITASLNKNNMILLDYLYQPWSKYEFAQSQNSQLQDLNKISAGYEYSGVRGQGFWDQIPLRGGVSYEQTQYKALGKSINQVSVYAGFSVPLDVTSSVDLGFQYGMRGTKDVNLLKENIFRFNMTINFGEPWFLRNR